MEISPILIKDVYTPVCLEKSRCLSEEGLVGSALNSTRSSVFTPRTPGNF